MAFSLILRPLGHKAKWVVTLSMRTKDVLSVIGLVVLIAVGSYARQTGFLRNEHLLVAGNDPGNGSGKVWYTSRFADNVTVIDMGGLHVSSACGVRHPARCRNLLVNSTYHGDHASSHAVFVPLDNGFYVIEITHNGSTRRSMYTSHETFHAMEMNPSVCPSNCVSVGIFKIGTQHYSLCATHSNSVCTCELNRIENSAEYVLQRCHSHMFRSTSILHQLSNIVALHNPRQPPLLFFFIGNILYSINLRYATSSLHLEIPESVCPTIEQIILEDHKLHIYCTNVSATYDLNDEHLLIRRQLLLYPCSSTTNVTIDLGVAERVSNLTYRSEDRSTEILRTTALPGTSFLRFGTCITLRSNSVFLYLDWNDGLYLFNGTTNEFHHVNNTQGCIMDQCQWPQVFNNQYLAVRGSSEDSVVVYDVEDFQTPILTLHQVSYQVGVVIDNLQISQRAELTTTISASHASTLHLSPSLTISSAVMTTSLIPSSSLVILIQSPISTAVTTHDPTLNEVDNFNIIGTVIFSIALVIIFVIIVTTSIIVPVYIIYRKRRRNRGDSIHNLQQQSGLSSSSSSRSTFGASMSCFSSESEDHVTPQQESNPMTGPDNSTQSTLIPLHVAAC